ncbi:hypothetical protein ISCGN_017554 [Ixodes scapularis]
MSDIRDLIQKGRKTSHGKVKQERRKYRALRCATVCHWRGRRAKMTKDEAGRSVTEEIADVIVHFHSAACGCQLFKDQVVGEVVESPFKICGKDGAILGSARRV